MYIARSYSVDNIYSICLQLLTGLLILLRVAGLICGGFYGPYIYLVLVLTGVYLAGGQQNKTKKFYVSQLR